MSDDVRSPFNKWLKTEEGVLCNEIKTLPPTNPRSAEFLSNRLWLAYRNGWEAKEAAQSKSSPVQRTTAAGQ